MISFGRWQELTQYYQKVSMIPVQQLEWDEKSEERLKQKWSFNRRGKQPGLADLFG
jgi:hypothetical protein